MVQRFKASPYQSHSLKNLTLSQLRRVKTGLTEERYSEINFNAQEGRYE